MKVLVTGSEGYIGTVLVQELLNVGFDVTGLDTGYYSDGYLYPLKRKEYRLIKKDIRTVSEDDLKGFDAIVHLAELSNDPLGENNPAVTFDVNHQGTIKLATNAKKSKIPLFIYFSSCSVYGASENISDENSLPNPLTAYAKSKVMNEKALQQMADDSFSPVIFRNPTVFGASPRMRFDLVVNDLCGHAWVDKVIKMDSDGTPWRPFIHILDLSQAVIQTLKAPRQEVHNQLFNVGSNNSNFQIRQIAQIIAEVFPGCRLEFGSRAGDKRNYRVNFDKIKKILPRFQPKWDVKKGAEELKKIFKSIDLTREQFESRHYTRLEQIKFLKNSKKINEKFYWNI